MSYIINNSNAFVSIKLTEKGRETLAKGQLNFTYWGIGDSEINYDREIIVDENPTDVTLSGYTRMLRPVDKQPDFKSRISANSSEGGLNTLNEAQINTLKLTVNNQAETRGFFSASGSTYDNYTGTTYSTNFGAFDTLELSGSTNLNIGSGYDYEVGDLILIKLNNETIGDLDLISNNVAIPNLWFKIQGQTTTTTLNDTLILDRNTPNYSGMTGTTNFIIYKGGEIENTFGFNETTQYWNSNTLSFNGDSQISCGDLPVWNMSNVWCEDIIGMTGTSIDTTPSTPNEDYNRFGSNTYLGQKYPFLNYDCSSDNDTLTEDNCGLPGQSVIDGTRKSISILHYTNNTISNYYGEFFFFDDDKKLTLTLPNLMYHRRNFSTELGSEMGMTFTNDTTIKYLGLNNVEYYDLIEDSTMVNEVKVVGKVFPQYKTVVFDDDEIVAAMSYKSNRNWTLPPLSATLVSSISGSTGGTLDVGETMYITYTLDDDTSNGLQTSLPCQYYTKITNNTASSKDVQFKIDDIDYLPYMRKTEKGGYDGLGFNAKNFKVLYQIVSENTDRPIADSWLVTDYTSDSITSVSGETIDPLLLELQNSIVNDFIIDKDKYDNATTFSLIDSLSMATIISPETLQFGDERFFYGNLDTYIGATIFKTIFNLNISGDEFYLTSNGTRLDSDTNPPDIKISEVGIYDNNRNLVMIGKLSKPVALTGGNTIMIELGIDF